MDFALPRIFRNVAFQTRKLRQQRITSLGWEAFTILELLLVVSIIVITATFVVPASVSILRGSDLTRGGQKFADQLALARQTALSTGQEVEIRIYQYVDPNQPGRQSPNGSFSALQAFSIAASGSASALGNVQRLPASVIVDSGNSNPSNTLSSILSQSLPAPSVPAATAGSKLGMPIPVENLAYNSVSFHFLPDGSTDLAPPSNRWFMTLHNFTDGNNLQKPPANFFTIQIDATNGHIRTYRP
jgi:uncharacterized protein (TIGR02596 family)